VLISSHILSLSYILQGIRAPRTARMASEKSEPYGNEASEFASRRYMQRNVEFEVDTIDKSGGFIGSLYLNKTENAAVTLVKEGLATVHSFSADGLGWARQLYDAEVSSGPLQFACIYSCNRSGRGQGREAKRQS
jgi:staphylococcal nuclease domain-containing protein 1